jgi:hypothetical protein
MISEGLRIAKHLADWDASQPKFRAAAIKNPSGASPHQARQDAAAVCRHLSRNRTE